MGLGCCEVSQRRRYLSYIPMDKQVFPSPSSQRDRRRQALQAREIGGMEQRSGAMHKHDRCMESAERQSM